MAMNVSYLDEGELRTLLRDNSAGDRSVLVVLPHHISPNGTVVFPQSSRSLIKRFRASKVEVLLAAKPDNVAFQDEHGAEWLGPLLLISASAITHDPNIIGITLSVIATYLVDYFRGKPKPHRAKFGIVLKNGLLGRKSLKITYDGPADSIEEFRETVREAKRTWESEGGSSDGRSDD